MQKITRITRKKTTYTVPLTGWKTATGRLQKAQKRAFYAINEKSRRKQHGGQPPLRTSATMRKLRKLQARQQAMAAKSRKIKRIGMGIGGLGAAALTSGLGALIGNIVKKSKD